jgi:hypothetical protein
VNIAKLPEIVPAECRRVAAKMLTKDEARWRNKRLVNALIVFVEHTAPHITVAICPKFRVARRKRTNANIPTLFSLRPLPQG